MRIREGNDFNVAWKIFQAGAAVDLSQVTEKRLTFSVFGNKTVYTNYTVSGQTLTIEFPKEVTTVKGDYRLIFEYTIPDSGQSDGDLKRTTDVVAFRIVPFTADADTDMTVNVSSDVAIAFKGDKGDDGDDAYQIWLDLGNTGTYEDFISYLRQPATDAAASISELEQEISENEGERVLAENERKSAELARANAEGDETKGRVKAENERVIAEGERDEAESLRELAELARANAEGDSTKGRIKAENLRVEAESERVENENGREQAENERDTSEGIRVSAETARNTAEGLRSSAETLRGTNEATRQTQESARQTNTATAISNANMAASAANTAAGLADDARLAIQADLALKVESEIYSETEYNEI